MLERMTLNSSSKPLLIRLLATWRDMSKLSLLALLVEQCLTSSIIITIIHNQDRRLITIRDTQSRIQALEQVHTPTKTDLQVQTKEKVSSIRIIEWTTIWCPIQSLQSTQESTSTKTSFALDSSCNLKMEQIIIKTMSIRLIKLQIRLRTKVPRHSLWPKLGQTILNASLANNSVLSKKHRVCQANTIRIYSSNNTICPTSTTTL